MRLTFLALFLFFVLAGNNSCLQASCLDSKVYRLEVITNTNTFPGGMATGPRLSIQVTGVSGGQNGYFSIEGSQVALVANGPFGGFYCPQGNCTISQTVKIWDACLGSATTITLSGSLPITVPRNNQPNAPADVLRNGLSCSVDPKSYGCAPSPCKYACTSTSNIAIYGYVGDNCCSKWLNFTMALPTGSCETSGTLPDVDLSATPAAF